MYGAIVTLNIARNLPESGSIFAFDLDPADAAAIDQHTEDRELTDIHLSAPRMDFEELPAELKVHNARVFGVIRHWRIRPVISPSGQKAKFAKIGSSRFSTAGTIDLQ